MCQVVGAADLAEEGGEAAGRQHDAGRQEGLQPLHHLGPGVPRGGGVPGQVQVSQLYPILYFTSS